MSPQEAFMKLLASYGKPEFAQAWQQFASYAQQQSWENTQKILSKNAAEQFSEFTEPYLSQMKSMFDAMGYVPKAEHDKALQQIAQLKSENDLLKTTLRDLQQTFFNEATTKSQQAWKEMLEKQLEVNREISRGFFDALKQPPQGKDS